MARVLSEYELAWRKVAGHVVPPDGVVHDDDELEQLTAPPVTPVSPTVVTPPPAPAVDSPLTVPATTPAPPPSKPTGKR